MIRAHIKLSKEFFDYSEFIEGEIHLETTAPLSIEYFVLYKFRNVYLEKILPLKEKIIKSSSICNSVVSLATGKHKIGGLLHGKENSQPLTSHVKTSTPVKHESIGQILDFNEFIIFRNITLSSGHHIIPFKIFSDYRDNELPDALKDKIIFKNLISFDDFTTIAGHRFSNTHNIVAEIKIKEKEFPVLAKTTPNVVAMRSKKEKIFVISIAWLCFLSKKFRIKTTLNKDFYICGDDIMMAVNGPRIIKFVEARLYRRIKINQNIDIQIIDYQKKNGNIMCLVLKPGIVPCVDSKMFCVEYFVEMKVFLKHSTPIILNREVYIYKKRFFSFSEMGLLKGRVFEESILL